MQTPASILSKWCLLPLYAILISIPNKLLGIIAMFSAIFRLLLLLSVIDISKSSIQIGYSYILWWVMLHPRKIEYIIYFVFVYYAFKNSEIVYCMDPYTEMSLTLQDKITQLENKIIYCQEQAAAADRDLNEVLNTKKHYEDKGEILQWQREYDLAESAVKDTNTNLNSEIRMRNILKAKLESGDYDMTSKSTGGKRKLESGDYDMTSKSTAAKRKSTE